MITDITLTVTPEQSADESYLRSMIVKKAEISQGALNDYKLIKRSIDARQRQVKMNLTFRIAYGEDAGIVSESRINYRPVPSDAPQVIIVGAGPAGLFAALRAIELGLKPIVLERGKDVDTRRIDLAQLSRSGEVDSESNYCFGEGGAGAYSDGKLYTRSKKRGNVDRILRILHQHGAAEDILYDAHPHIGTDRLPGVIKNIRNTIIRNGGEVHFESKVSGLNVNGDSVDGVVLASGKEFSGPVVLATGHSARDVYRFLNKQNIELEPKSLAIGVRLEHPQETIDKLRYHMPQGRGKVLPAAEYVYVTQVDGRGVYSFCMCPGGVVVPAMSGPNQSVVNGMSASARASQWANSGMVVELHPGDIKGFEDKGVLEMLEVQESLEKRFFDESKSINAPAQRMKDFVDGKESVNLPRSSYAPGIHSARLDKLLPDFISSRLRKGFRDFDRKNRGFLTNDAIVLGLESRTSSPVRIPRDKESLEHVGVRNLYPAGEGAGYAGGIVSAAMDGEKSIDALARNSGMEVE